jgi:hypothetical protein
MRIEIKARYGMGDMEEARRVVARYWSVIGRMCPRSEIPYEKSRLQERELEGEIKYRRDSRQDSRSEYAEYARTFPYRSLKWGRVSVDKGASAFISDKELERDSSAS